MENELQLLQDKNKRLEKEVADLLEKLQLINKKVGELEKENKRLKEERENKEKEVKENDTEIINMLEVALAETVKIDSKLSNFKSSVEVPPKK